MIPLDLKQLLGRLNSYLRRSVETAASLSVGFTHYEVAVEHLLVAMDDDGSRDIGLVFRRFGLERAPFEQGLRRAAEGFRRGNAGRPVFSPALIDLLTDAWLIASVEFGHTQIRSGTVIAALLANPSRYAMTEWFDPLRVIPLSTLKANFREILAASSEEAAPPRQPMGEQRLSPSFASSESALERFTVNLTEQARQGRIDPVFGREREMRQMIDILGRRRKNNPICVGEPGVGKTAVVESLVLKMVSGDVPDFLKDVDLLSLDLGMLQAGAGVKGEFEKRLKTLIDEVKAAPKPVVLFIDEAHMLVGSGASAGSGDAANLLKPALARGELRTIAATTWSEYKQYFEKDPALVRRFQLVKLDEPSPEEATVIVRGLRAAYEAHHGVYIRDDAVAAAARLSARYITGRQLPDKAIDVLDTACARVKLSLSTRPALIDEQEVRIATLTREREALRRDGGALGLDVPRVAEVDEAIARSQDDVAQALAHWEREKALVAHIVTLRGRLGLGPARDGEAEPLPGEERTKVEAELRQAVAALDEARGDQATIQYEVTAETIGQVIADWTGIPVGTMVKDEAAAILGLGDSLRRHIRGQDHAIAALDEGMRAAKAGVNNPGQPMGVFLFVGPSGVGKTELATKLADLLFGGERFLITINMSEFQEKHTVSKLVGAPAGYVGYGEGGLLTEAVRQRPYSVVLLDECEKADPEVLNLFYQVFDKGRLADGEGRVVDFKNTVIILTSNLASDLITDLGSRDERPDAAQIAQAIRPVLSRHFKPALLARMRVVPFVPLLPEVLDEIVRIKLDRVGERLRESRAVAFSYGDGVVQAILSGCTDIDSGARRIDHLIDRTLLPEIATSLLRGLDGGEVIDRLHVEAEADGSFRFDISHAPAPRPVALAAE